MLQKQISKTTKGAVTVYSAAVLGVEAKIINVEVDQRPGMIRTLIVGMADKACIEAKERIKSSLRNSDIPLPDCQVVFNLAPAQLPKAGTGFDLAMAIGLLVRRGFIKKDLVNDYLFVGELSLDGILRPINGILAITIAAKEAGFKGIILPDKNKEEASMISGIKILPANNLDEVIKHLNSQISLKEYKTKQEFKISNQHTVDFTDIIGQEQAKRALEIAAAGGHHVLMVGPPGSGKTMLAKALYSILPQMKLEEAIDVTKIHSVSKNLDNQSPLVFHRPWRSPHHSASAVSLVGGGAIPKPGEITLAHKGILFLDEIAEFSRTVLDQLRQPLEEGNITISRAQYSFNFPTQFLLVAAMNPCPCGFYTDTNKECTCTAAMVARYQKRLSGPLLDRFDLFLHVSRSDDLKISNQNQIMNSKLESSSKISKRVELARKRQYKRGCINQELKSKQLQEMINFDEKTKMLLDIATAKLQLSHRAYFRVLKVARTIADLEGVENIDSNHIAESLQYRNCNILG